VEALVVVLVAALPQVYPLGMRSVTKLQELRVR